MAEVLLLHHAQGLTPGVLSFAERLRAAGHVVHTPDLYDGRTFDDLDEGVDHARSVGFEEMVQRGVRSAEGLPEALVYAGMSLGAMPAQTLLMDRPGALGGVVLHAAVDPADLGGTWPAGVPAQVHVMEQDDWGDVDVARALAEAVEEVELHLYPGDRHLFTDDSLDAYDAEATALVLERVMAFLAEVDRRG